MSHAIRPGEVLADRYLLVDLLSESGNGRFWRAHDRILQRHVAVHVVASDDERAERLMEAARHSATVVDARILRVLDVDQRDDCCYVVNEWGSGTSLDILVANEGPVPARRAAWIVSEVAGALTVAHDTGVCHGRLIPENVLVDHTGAVRVIGFSVEAALLGLPPGRRTSDVTDLAGLLYFLLTGTWAGMSRSAVPAAPQENGRVLRPRQVRAGVPRALDHLCDRVINPYAAGEPDGPPSAAGIAATLREFVGDTAGMAAAEAAAGQRSGIPTTPVIPSSAPPPGPVTPPAPVEPEQASAEVAGPEPAPEQPTQAGLPIFDDENDDVSWLAARAEVPPPPPPFEEPPDRPLFAPEPTDGRPARRTRPGTPASTSAPGGTGYWPWDTSGGPTTGSGVIPATEDEPDEEVPGRNWLRLAAAVGVSVLLLLAVVFAFNLGRGRSPLGAVETDEPSPSTPSSATAEPITGVTAVDLDPQGDPPEENPELAPLTVDGDPATSWRTMTYTQDLGPGGLKTGVGLTLDLGGEQEVTGVDLSLVGAPTGLSIYVTDSAPTGVRALTPVATTTAEARARITLDEPATGRFLVVWLTSLPEIPGGYRGEVAEVTVRG